MTEENTAPVTEPAGEVEGVEQLGDAGKRALDRMKQERNEARTALKSFQELGLSAESLAEIVQKHTEHDQEAALSKARQEGVAEARKGFEQQLRAMAVREQAAGMKFHDPAAAVLFLGDRLSEVSFDGDAVDVESVRALLSDVVEKNPYLVQKEEGSYSDTGLGAQSQLALNGDGIENALKKKLGIR